MKKRIQLLRTLLKLGPFSLWNLFLYKLKLKLHLGPLFKQQDDISPLPILNDIEHDLSSISNLITTVNLFGWKEIEFSNSPPRWNYQYISQQLFTDYDKNWFEISDFRGNNQDIKEIWELSRADWILTLCRDAENEPKLWGRLEAWLEDWISKNPPYRGPQWKCGQETALRLLHLTFIHHRCDSKKNLGSQYYWLVEKHLDRVVDTLPYAISQKNNHATSEAAALFIGGAILMEHPQLKGKGENFLNIGRKNLEKCAKNLIMSDGSFSQYSTSYHRLMLDVISYVEYSRQRLDIPTFSDSFYSKMKLATLWLAHHVLPESGLIPLLGAQDGADFFAGFQLKEKNVLFSVNLASLLFLNSTFKSWSLQENTIFKFMNLDPAKEILNLPPNRNFAQGGFATCKNKDWTAFVKYPQFRFRPSQADSLHVDLWHKGLPLFVDSGSYSYAHQKLHAYFTSNRAHNTVQFGAENEMTPYSRFLLINWSKTSKTAMTETHSGVVFEVTYQSGDTSLTHHRAVDIRDQNVVITDTFPRNDTGATLRWHLAHSEWNISDKNELISNLFVIKIECDEPVELTLKKAPMAEAYLKLGECLTLEAQTLRGRKITTTVVKR